MAFESWIAVAGFLLAAYAIVANDAIQTLGTFLSSNAKRPWWVLWLFASSILTTVLVYGWWAYDGDVSYGRLSSIPPSSSWVVLVPPLVLLVLTRLGAPVSTTFLVLTAFAPRALESMVFKSLLGYGVAFFVSAWLYRVIAKRFEGWVARNRGKPPGRTWTVLQWLSTGFLWSQWLIQDLANVFVFLPRRLPLPWLLFSLFTMLLLHAILFAQRGGGIQKIVLNKTHTEDIRSATVIDFVYGLLLLFFKELSHVPMSTTWVFLGLLAGRELMVGYKLSVRRTEVTTMMIARDVGLAALGLFVSVGIALMLPYLAAAF